MPPRVSFLGLGAIGTPMASHLVGRYDLAVWNRTAARAEVFVQQHGGRAVPTPRAAATGSSVVFTCLPTSRDLERLLDGPDGLEGGLERGALLIDCTSGDPATSIRIAQRLAMRGVGFIDAPVSGGTNGAAAGTLTVMAGGAEADVQRGRPYLESFATRIEHVGPVGAGHALKAINNSLLAVNILALAEGLAGLAKAGVAPRKALEVLNASSGRSFVSEVLVPERVLTGAFPNTFRLALLAKDVGIGVQLLESQHVGGPMISLAAELFRAARAALGEEADYLEAIKLIERQAGVELRG
ncbi:MAG TPA: NAD(P)-dependent oxidoreductase [Gemmatimonadales bacterium]|jgi:3-hydroxyisobutyrate dehydrogenase|nr:NAD(P)-dependent oxidoreductase [Gemmatimonadales bacterium]